MTKDITHRLKTPRLKNQAGNAIVFLFAAIAMAGTVTYGLNNVMRGPGVTASEVTRKTVAENNLVASTRMAIVASAQQAGGGDCDGDGFVEPLPYRDAGALPKPAGGGLIPMTMGASLSDPWGTQYGYCVWDPGTASVSNAVVACGGVTPRRLQGAPRDDQYAIAVISAGKNGAFETSCVAYVDTTPADGVPDATMLNKPAGSDDIVLAYSYAEANGVGGGIWKLKPGDDTTATVNKNIETLGGATFNDGPLTLQNKGLVLPGDPGDDTVTGACDAAKEQQLRRNVGDGSAAPTIEICNSGTWEPIAGGGGLSGNYAPPTHQVHKIYADPAAANVLFNNPVISGDIAIIGAHADDVLGANAGAAYIFTKSSNIWTQDARLTASDGAGGDTLGFAVSTDGTTAMAGAFGHAGGAAAAGAVYVYTQTGGLWPQTQKLVASDPTVAANFGAAVHVSGNVAIIGAPVKADSGANSGAAYIFNKSGTWTQSQKLAPSDPAANKYFGRAVLVEGNTAIIAGAGDNGFRGAVYVFTKSGPTWTQTQKLVASDGAANDMFGFSIDMDGSTLVVGAWQDDDGGADSGAVYVFTNSGGTWTEAQKLVASDADAGDKFGNQVSISGNNILVGAVFDEDGGIDRGSAYIFSKSGSTWSQTAKLKASDAEDGEKFGNAVAIDGESALIGADHDDDGGTMAGAAYVFGPSPASPLSADSVSGTQTHPLDVGLVSHWKMDEGTGTVVNDSIGTNHGAFVNTPTWIQGVNGPGAVSFNKADQDAVQITGLLGSPTAATVTAWVNVNSLDSSGSEIFTIGNGLVFRELPTGLTAYVPIGSLSFSSVTGPPIKGTGWRYVAVTYDDALDAIRLYIDGTQVASNTAALTVNWGGHNGSGNSFIGRHGGGGVIFDLEGGVDDVRFYNRALGPAEVAALSYRALHSSREREKLYLGASTAGAVGKISASAFTSHSCAIKLDGSAWCWGIGTFGQLGNGAALTQHAPVRVRDNGPWIKISVSDVHSCGLKADGSLWCWGYDGSGQLGNGATTTANQTRPVQVSGAGPWADIHSAYYGSCGIKADGSAWCWGEGDDGQLGDGSATSQTSPIQVSGTGPWVAIAMGVSPHTCGIKSNGSAWCWGRNLSGQLGNGTNTSSNTPVPVSGGGQWVKITAGNTHSCGIQSDGSAWCWGAGGSGNLGNGTTASTNTPVKVVGDTPWIDISAGNVGSCGIKIDGSAWCWGSDTAGQLGNGATITANQSSPVLVSGGGIWTSIQASLNRTCGMKIDGSAWCWGVDNNGQLGNGSVITANQTVPYPVSNSIDAAPWSWNDAFTTIMLNGNTTLGLNTGGNGWMVTSTTQYFGFSDAGKMVLRQDAGNNQLLIEGTAAAQPAQISFRAGNEAVASADYTTGRVAEWLFDDSSGTTATASVGGLNGTISGPAAWNTSGGRKGDNVAVTNGVLEFEGNLNPSRVSVANNATLRPTDITLSVWIRADGPQETNASIISKAHTANLMQPYESYGLRFTGPTEVAFSKGSIVRSETTSATIKPGAWTHIVGSYGATAPRNRLYVNGVLVGTSSDVNAIAYDGTISGNLFIGAAGCAAMPCQQYRGSVDDLRIYNTQLTDAQVYQLYKNQSAAMQVPHSIGIDQAANNLEIARNNAGMTNLLNAVTPDLALTAAGNLAVGAATAQSRVDVSSGGVKIGYQPYCTSSSVGAIRYNPGYGYYCPSISDTWKPRASSQTWRLIASSADGTKLAANVIGGQIYSSNDGGVTWAARESNRTWWGLASSADGSKLVATVDGGQIYTSTDSGATWTARESNRAWRQVASSADGTKLVAAVGGGQLYTSTNSGVTWTPRDSNRAWLAVASSSDGTKLVAVVTGGQIYTSTDSGVTWTPRDSNRNWNGVASSSDGNYLLASVSGGQLYTSMDSGANWTARDSNRSWQVLAVSYNGLRQYATTLAGKIYMSVNFGTTWTVVDSTRNWAGITTSADGYKTYAAVAGGQIYASDGCKYHVASCGKDWEQSAPPQANGYHDITFGGGQFVAVSIDGGNRVATSPDGFNWTMRAHPEANEWRGVTYGNGLYVAVASTGTNKVMTSPDGITWTPRAAANSLWYDVTYGNGLFVAVSAASTLGAIITSPDGITWTQRFIPEAVPLTGITYGNGLFVAVATGGTNRVMTSPDGINWTGRTAAQANGWSDVTYGNGQFVAVSYDGTNRVMTSPDGITWTARDAALSNTWYGIAYGGGQFVAVSNNGNDRAMTSPDGINWTLQSTPNEGWFKIAYGYNRMVAVAYSGGSSRAMYATCSSQDAASPWKYCNGSDWVDVPPVDTGFKGVLTDLTYDGAWYHSCAVNNIGHLYCFGDQANGKLGNGVNPTSTDGSIIPGLLSPVKIGTDTWKKVGVAFSHSCGIKTNGTLWCWGAQTNGRLGNGLTVGAQTTPLQIGASNWKDIATYRDHTCGIRANGTLWCWGMDSGQALGNGATSTDQTTPLQIGVATWEKITASSSHTCGIQTNGTLWCWGNQANGVLGNGLTAGTQDTPLQIGTDTWTNINAAQQHTCGIKSAGTLWCWGNQANGRLGNGITTGTQATPVQISAGTFWKDIGLGFSHTCGIQVNGTLWCWGDDSFEALGNGAGGSVSSPLQIGSDLWAQIESGNYHSLGMKADRSIWGWGSGGFGNLGIGVMDAPNIPTATISGN